MRKVTSGKGAPRSRPKAGGGDTRPRLKRNPDRSRNAPDDLRQNEWRYRILLNSSSDGIFVLDGKWRFTVINRSALRFLKLTRREVQGRPLPDVVPEIREWPFFAHLQKIMKSRRRATVTEEYRLRDGRRGWFQVRLDPVPGGMLCVLRDITDSKTAENRLRDHDSRFRALIENSSDAISLVGADGQVIFNGPSYFRIMGYAEAEWQGKSAFDLLHPDDVSTVMKLFTSILDERTQVALPPVRVKHADGEWHWIEGVARNLLAEPSVSAIVVNFRDITERKRAEEALTMSEARFRDLTELLPQIIFEADRRGRLTYVNRQGYKTSGYGPEDLQAGFDFISAVVPEDRARITKMVARILKGEKTQGTEYTVLRKDGSTFPVLTYSAPILVNDRVEGIRGLIVDVTDQKKMERELAETKAILEQAIAQTPIPMVLATAPDTIIRMVNAAAREIMGVGEGEEATGLPLVKVRRTWVECDRQGMVRRPEEHPLARALLGEKTKNVLMSIRRGDGTTRWELVSGSPIRDRNGGIIAAFAVFPDVTETILAEEELKQRLAVEQLAAEISADFINLYSDKIDSGVTRALKKIARFSSAGCATLSLFSGEKDVITNTHEWARSPAESQFSRFPGNHLGLYEHYLPDLNQNHTIVVSRRADYPEPVLTDGHWLEVQGFRSFLLTPLFRSGQLYGMLGLFGETDREITWPFHTITLLGFVGDMIITLLNRKQTENELNLYREHLEELVSQRTEELERSRLAAVNLMETATIQRQRAEEALRDSTRMAEALKESQTRLRLATRSAEIGIVETDLTMGEVIWDEICANIHGLPPEQRVTVDEYFKELVLAADREATRASLRKALASPSGHWGRVYRILRPGGEIRWVTEDHFILRNETGKAVRMIGAKQDVTARNRAEEQIKTALIEKETLLREIHHRVKNNLNTISNLLYFQTKLLHDQQAVSAFQDSQNRIQSMARIHEHLYRSWDLATVDMQPYLSDLIVELAQTYGAPSARIDLTCAGVALDIDRAVPCGLIINELISNAMKYAFDKDETANQINILLAEEGGNYVIEVADNGRGLREGWQEEHLQSLGIRLVTMFCQQLSGTLEVSGASESGAAFRITFPRARMGRTE